MSYIFDKIPYFRCLIRREFTVNHTGHYGEYLKAIAVGIRCQRGLSLYFQCWIVDPYATGAMFLLPIDAICFKPCVSPKNLIQPWDTFSSDFGVTRLEIFHRSKAYVLPDRAEGRYMMTIDFTGNELADDLEQHKHLHLIKMDKGWLAAVPNNRVLIEDGAFFDNPTTTDKPDFISLEPEYFAE